MVPKVLRVRVLAAGLVAAWLFLGIRAEAKLPDNMFMNPGFEQGQAEWKLDKAGKTAARFTVDKAPGEDAPSGRVTIDAVEDWGTQFGQSMDAGAPGKTYTFAVVAKSAADPVPVRLEIERRANPYDRAALSDKVTLKKEAWTEVHVTFRVEKPFPQGWFAYISCVQPKAEYRIRLARLYEGEYVPYDKVAKEEVQAAGAALFDTGAASSAPLSGEAVAKKAGWAQVPENQAARTFKGDAVFMNDRLALVLRRGGPGAEVYALGATGPVARAVLAPAAGDAAPRLESVAVIKNSPEAVVVDASFKAADGKALGVRYELAMGQPFVKTEARAGAKALRIEAPCRFAILPDFFADDMVIDACDIPVAKAEVPSENFLLEFLGGGDAVLVSVASAREEDARLSVGGEGAARRITASEIAFGKDGKVWVAVLEAPGVWHVRNVPKEEADKIVRLDWKMPYPAQWRIDWRQADKLAGSWEVLLEKPGGRFEKPGVFGNPDTLPANRKRWLTVLGQFAYPCWIDREGQGHLQPLKSGVVRFEGPALLYPINRVRGTPLDAFTVVDIMRATLGVGPCEYILDLEGQKHVNKGRATCSARDALRGIYGAKQQREKRAEVEKILQEVMVFVRFIRSRIEGYVAFSHDLLAYLEREKKARPGQAAFIDEMATMARSMDGYVEKRKAHIKTPDEAQAMVDTFRATLLDAEGDDATAKVKTFTEAVVDIGGNQDELAGECRMVVKNLRQRAGLAMATDPRAAETAKEIRKRTQEVLRQPAGHEGARH
jgi:hypothetical protein